MMGQPKKIRERIVKRMEDFAYHLLVDVFNAEGTADIAIEAICKAGSYDSGTKAERIEDPAEWTPEKIMERAASISSDKGPEGDFDD